MTLLRYVLFLGAHQRPTCWLSCERCGSPCRRPARPGAGTCRAHAGRSGNRRSWRRGRDGCAAIRSRTLANVARISSWVGIFDSMDSSFAERSIGKVTKQKHPAQCWDTGGIDVVSRHGGSVGGTAPLVTNDAMIAATAFQASRPRRARKGLFPRNRGLRARRRVEAAKTPECPLMWKGPARCSNSGSAASMRIGTAPVIS